tara:strand:+ start:35992 stop:36714 length:723 start_codon:yes stop_codon:yes gene_type:complete
MKSCLLFLSLLLSSSFTVAGIKVTPMTIDVRATQTRIPVDIKVVNDDAKLKAYVQVTPSKVVEPGMKQQKEIPMTGSQKRGVVTSPAKLIIPGSQFRKVRVLLTQPPAKTDRVFRVLVEPVTDKLNGDDRQVGVQILLAYKVLLIQLPKDPVANISMKRDGKTLTIKNTGNSNALMFNGQACVKDKCSELPVKRVYAGNVWEVTLPAADSMVSYQLQAVNNISDIKLAANQLSVSQKVEI